MSKRVKYMETGYIGVVSDGVATKYKKKDPDGDVYRILGDAKEEAKADKKAEAEAKKASEESAKKAAGGDEE